MKKIDKDTIFVYFLLVSFIIVIISGIVVVVADFIQGPIPNYLKYSFKNTEVAKKVSKKICTRNRRIYSNK